MVSGPSPRSTQEEIISAGALASLASNHSDDPVAGHDVVFDVQGVTVSYSGRPAIKNVDMKVHKNLVTAFIGPSGCGKTTLLRSFNRMNDLIRRRASRARSLPRQD